MQIELKSNSRAVAKAFRDLARQYPEAMSNVLTQVGQTLRKEVKLAIQGKGHYSGEIKKLDPLTLKIRRLQGNSKRTMGGKLPQLVRYKKHGKTSVRVDTLAPDAMRRFQTPEDREYTEREKALVARATVNGLSQETNRFRVKHYADLVTETKKKPARPVFISLAQWPGLAKRISDAGVNAVKRMAERAARKARAAT